MTDKIKKNLRLDQFKVGFLVHDVSRLRRTVIDKALKPWNVTRSQWWVLANLARHTGVGMMQTELASVLDIGKVALGGLLDRLEAHGFVVRVNDPHDRRAKRIEITPAGMNVLDDVQKHATALNLEMVEGISEADLKLVETILAKMKARLVEMDPTRGGSDTIEIDDKRMIKIPSSMVA